MERNFLNLTQKEKDKPIFRVISNKRLFQLFDNKENVLVNPKLWDDPFENFLMNSTGELTNGEMFSIGFRNNFFGQCWTKTRESDAMWRIYSPDKNGVRIMTTPRKLLKSLFDSAGEFKNISCYIGNVKYYTTPKLETLLKANASSWILDSSGAGQAQTLLFKRTPFKHENEIRIIFNGQGKIEGNLYPIKINPFEFIEDIVFDPRIQYSEFRNEKLKLQKMGFKNRIVKSKLYHAPKMNFKLHI